MKNSLITVSLDDLRRAVTIREQMETLEQELKQLGPSLDSATEPLTKKLHYSQTPAGRLELSRRMKLSWKRRHAAARA